MEHFLWISLNNQKSFISTVFLIRNLNQRVIFNF